MAKKKPSKKKKSAARKPLKTSPRSKTKTQTIIATKTAVHGFNNTEILILQQSLIVAKAFEQNASRSFSYSFLQTLSNNVPTFKTQTFSGAAFRIVPPGKKNSALDDKATLVQEGE